MLYSPNAKFWSREQAVAAQICADRKSDLLLVLPTGFGKLLIFMMCGVNDYEQMKNMHTIIFIPLISLLYNLKARFRQQGQDIAEWKWLASQQKQVLQGQSNICLVTIKTAATDNFKVDIWVSEHSRTTGLASPGWMSIPPAPHRLLEKAAISWLLENPQHSTFTPNSNAGAC